MTLIYLIIVGVTGFFSSSDDHGVGWIRRTKSVQKGAHSNSQTRCVNLKYKLIWIDEWKWCSRLWAPHSFTLIGFTGGGSMTRNDENKNGRLAEDERWRNSLRRPRYFFSSPSVNCGTLLHDFDLMTSVWWQQRRLLTQSKHHIICRPFVAGPPRIERHSVRLITLHLLLLLHLRQPTTTTIATAVQLNRCLALAPHLSPQRRQQGVLELLLLPLQIITRDKRRQPGRGQPLEQEEIVGANPHHQRSTGKNWWRKSHKNSVAKYILINLNFLKSHLIVYAY